MLPSFCIWQLSLGNEVNDSGHREVMKHLEEQGKEISVKHVVGLKMGAGKGEGNDMIYLIGHKDNFIG